MAFTSLQFFTFFCIVVFLHFAIRPKGRPLLLLIASVLFCASWGIPYTLILACSILLNYGIARLLSARSGSERKVILYGGIAINLAVLVFFKYADFFFGWLLPSGSIAQNQYHFLVEQLIVPIGISFYTFQVLAYLIDVYYKRTEPERNPIIFALFMSFFPQILSGPIPRASQLIPQLRSPKPFDEVRVSSGLRLVLWGIFKKVVIADQLAVYVGTIYGDPRSYSGLPLILATTCFAFQIYADFSGYTSIARGLARILGYELTENFRQPYLAVSISDFWQRWHMSLSSWIRDYLFFPLSRSLLSRFKRPEVVHITVSIGVMVLIGLWHGPAWTFVIWGLLHGLYLGLLGRGIRNHKHLSTLITFGLVWFAWIFFRAASVDDAFYIVTHLLTFSDPALKGFQLALNVRPDIEALITLVMIIGLITIDWFNATHRINFDHYPIWMRWGIYYAAILGLLVFGAWGNHQFLYFQF